MSDTQIPAERSFKSVAAQKNRQRTILMAEEAFIHYLGLGVKRSYGKLQDLMAKTNGFRPSLQTITRWANIPNEDGKIWANRIEEYERKVQSRLEEMLITNRAEHAFDHIGSVEKIAEQALRRVQAMLTGVADPVLDKLGIRPEAYTPDCASPEENVRAMNHLLEVAERAMALAERARTGPIDATAVRLRDANDDPVELARRVMTYNRRAQMRAEGKLIDGPAAPVTLIADATPEPKEPASVKPNGNGHANGSGNGKAPVTLSNVLDSPPVQRKKPSGNVH
jgi:hypothetical protein